LTGAYILIIPKATMNGVQKIAKINKIKNKAKTTKLKTIQNKNKKAKQKQIYLQYMNA
jgi:uncharacterized protein YnzC (UPF0291/DUF896 family)